MRTLDERMSDKREDWELGRGGRSQHAQIAQRLRGHGGARVFAVVYGDDVNVGRQA